MRKATNGHDESPRGIARVCFEGGVAIRVSTRIAALRNLTQAARSFSELRRVIRQGASRSRRGSARYAR